MTESEPWSIERVLALAPDPGGATAGRRLATVRAWSAAGYRAQPPALWGTSQGSAAQPYETVVDLTGPAYSCSCPSRKFPCKHALGLMLLWAAGGVPVAEQPADFADRWLARRAAGPKPAGGPARTGPADPQAAAKRVADRAARVSAGLEELDQWLGDQIRTGLAGLDRSVYGQFESIAARMVDAQAPAVAARLRRLEGVLLSGEGWPGRLLEQYAQLRLLIRAHRRLAELPQPLAAVVRAHVGYPTSSAEVRAGPPVRDVWSVLSLRETEEDRLISRRIWLQGAGTGRSALLLSYVPVGRSFDDPPVPGTSLDADLHFYPAGERALIGARHGEPGQLSRPVAVGVAEALAGYAAALAVDPWLVSRSFLLDAVVPVRHGEGWVLRDGSGDALPITGSAGDPWRLVACSGGEPVTVVGEWAAEGFLPLSVVRHRELVRL